jgi:glycosyltransferase involved in cell wall biosynthesis
MRILVIGQGSNPGGVEAVIKRYYEAVKNNIQFDFIVCTDTCYNQEYYESNNCEIFFVKSAQFRHPLKYKKEIKNFFKNKKNTYDAIWCNCCDLANFGYIVKQAEKIGIKKRIVHAHNNQLMHTGKKRYFYKLMHNYWKYKIDRYATDFWACSEEAGKFFYKNNILKSDKFRIINNAIEVKKYYRNEHVRNEVRAQLGISDNNIVIGNVGRFQYQKNHDFLIDIYNSFCKKYPDSRLILVGQGVEEAAIKNKVKSLNIEKNVIYMGIRNDVNKIMQAIDAFVLPSRFEGLGIVLIEAQAAGVPCVTSKNVVPSVVNVTGNVEFVGLDEAVDKWVEAIEMQMNKKIDYKESNIKVTEAGYDIEIEGDKFRRFLES